MTNEPSVSDRDPTDDERRRAVCAAMTGAPGLLRYAIRFSRCLADAEDAYQRAMEIALTQAPDVAPEAFRAWLRTVIRNEALLIMGRLRREGPAPDEDATQVAALVPDGGSDLALRADWRERYHSVQDALADLSEAERMCVMLQCAGASYRAIEQTTGFSPRKVERCLTEGRAALHSWELRLSHGEVCNRLLEPIDRVATGHTERGDRRRVARHTRHCGACRSLLRARRESNHWMGALVPVALVATASLDARPPDPSPGLAWAERGAAAATVRLGHLMQVAFEAPGSLGTKMAAGAVMAVVAVGAGGQAAVNRFDGTPAAPEVVAVAIRPTPPVSPPVAAVPLAPVVEPPFKRPDNGGRARAQVVKAAATVSFAGIVRTARMSVVPPREEVATRSVAPAPVVSAPVRRRVTAPVGSATSEFDGL
jgi:RNA polymerase sigma factor (sigma-70 family)